jgi:hypothetical protein
VVLPAVSLLPSLLIVELVSSPSMRMHLCHRCAGIFAVFAVAAVALWPLCHLCHLCRRRGGIVALVTMVSSPLPVRRHLAAVKLASLPSLLVIELASFPLMPRHLCRRCDCDCRPHHYGVVTVNDAQVSLLLLSWYVIALVTVTSSPSILIRDGVVAVLKLAWFNG